MNQDHRILYPIFALFLLVIIVAGRLLTDRRKAFRERGLRFSNFANAESLKAAMPDSRSSDHFKNLFEMPILFYVVCLAALVEHKIGPVFLLLSWVYVVLRYVQAFIHLTYNRVFHRFLMFVTGSLTLVAMWFIFALKVFSQT